MYRYITKEFNSYYGKEVAKDIDKFFEEYDGAPSVMHISEIVGYVAIASQVVITLKVWFPLPITKED